MEEVRRLRSFPVADIGSLDWFSAQQNIMTLHGAIVSEMQHGVLSPSARLVQEEDKTDILVQEMISLAAWKRHVLPEIKHKDTIGQVFPIYSILFYETVYSSVLLSVMYCHENDLVTLFEEEVLCELMDHCVAHLVLLIGMTNKKTPLNLNPTLSEEDNNLTNAERINRFEQDLEYQVSNILLSILRLIIDHLEDLSLSLLTRIIQHHDVAMLLVHLVENQAWLNKDVEGNKLKYTDSWTKVKPEDRFLLSKYEAQAWKMLLDLLLHPKCAELYEISSYRQQELLKLEKHLHEIIIDQFPALQAFRHWFAQLKMTSGRNVAAKPLIVEIETGSIHNKLERANWPAITDNIIAMLNSPEYLSEIAAKHSDVYVNFEKYYTEGKDRKKGKDGQDGSKEGHLCGSCQERAKFRCSRCKDVWYCNKTCQVKDWDVHRKYCSV
ncbi:hypothetical protein WDU94_000638 [Cyamophila willieti]